jgi:hypothetical protein
MTMNRWLSGAAGVVVGVGLVAAAGVSATAARAQDAKKSSDGYVSLFDGQTLSGWEMLEMGPKGSSKWEVKDGALTGSGRQSMLFSPRGDYKNFRVRAEIKINDRGNSGMYVRTAKKPSFSDGYEVQINSTHTDPIKTGSVYTMVHVFKQLVPPDTWFTQEVEVINKDYRGKVLPHFKVWVNGDLLYEYIDHSNEHPEPGHFAFQQHDPGSVVQIRKVEVMELPEPAPRRAAAKK